MYKNIQGFSLAGVDHYFKLAKENGDVSKELFEDIELFEGGEFYDQDIDPIDNEILIDEIIERFGELVTYRQIPERFKKMSDNFFKKNYKNFAKMQIALQMDFNPIYNYDRYEDGLDTRTDSTNYKDKRTITPEGSETLTTDQLGKEKTKDTPHGSTVVKTEQGTNSGATTTQVSAFDSPNTWDNSQKVTTEIPEQKQTTSYGDNTYNETELSFDNRQTTTTTSFDERVTHDDLEHEYLNGNDKNEHDWHIFGNIGVVTSTAMIKEVLSLYDFDIYSYIADKYAHELLIMIY